MGGRRRAWLMAVLWLLLAAETGVKICRGWADEAVQDVNGNIRNVNEQAEAVSQSANEKVEAVTKDASEVYSNAKNTTDSWSNWANDTIHQIFNFVERLILYVQSTASSLINSVLGIKEEVKVTVHLVVDKAGDTATKTTQRINTEASNYTSEKAGESGKAASSLKSTSENTVEAAAEKAKETVVSGKDKAFWPAAGEMGVRNRIREKTAEL